MIEIEKNVPLPKPNKQEKYPFSQMEPGDSVFTDDPDLIKRYEGTSTSKFSSSAHSYANMRRKNGDRFRVAVRYVDGGCRVWRLE